MPPEVARTSVKLFRPAWRAEITRKVFHLSAVIIPLIYAYIDRHVALWILGGCLLLAAAVEVLRQMNERFRNVFAASVGFMLRRAEGRRITGATYLLLGALLAIWLLPKDVAIAVLLVLAVSDSVATLIGLRFGRNRFLGKSLAGSSAFFVTALVICWTLLADSVGVAFLAALAATGAEALPTFRLGRFEINDNVTVPLLCGLVICLLRGVGG